MPAGEGHPAHRARMAVGAASAGALVIISGLFATHSSGASSNQTTTTAGGQTDDGSGDPGRFQPPDDSSGAAVPFDPGNGFQGGGGFGGQPQTSSHGS